MSTIERRRLPISTRHAFALAFDLAVRRDPLRSLIIPTLLRTPWILALVLLPPVEVAGVSARLVLLTCLALIGDFITLIVVSAMLRIRARSVFNTPPGTPPMPATECYGRGLKRVPWLLVTEGVRNLVLALATSISIVPAVFLRFRPESLLADMGRNLLLLGVAFVLSLPSLFVTYRLAVATEAVVLNEHDLAGAFQASFRMMRGHLERWFELVLASGVLVMAAALLLAILSLAVPALMGTAGIVTFWLLVAAMGPVIQYAWTFFYLRLAEIDTALQLPRPAGPDGEAFPEQGSPAPAVSAGP